MLSYPQTDTFTDAELTEALSKVGLQRLAAQLDTEARWDRELSEDDDRLLAFARLSLHKPRWVVIDEVLETMEAPAQRRSFPMLRSELAGAARSSALGGRLARSASLFTRVSSWCDRPSPRPHQPVDPQLEATKA